MAAGKLVHDTGIADAENARQDAESKARLGLVGEQTRNAKTTADAGALDYEKALREDTLRKSLGTAAQAKDTAMTGTETPTGHAVDFQAVKKANRGFEQADAALWNSLNPGNPMTAEGLVSKRKRDEADAMLASEEKANKAGRDAAESSASLAETRARTKLLGAQADKAEAEAKNPTKAKDLPLDVKSEVQALSGKTAGKKAIANQLASDLVQMRTAMGQDKDGKPIPGAIPNEDLAYSYAQNMLKTMNSKEGADAVGVDEAKRAAGLLEYNIADVKAGLGMKPGKFHGRDIPGFMKQVETNINGIRGAVDANQAEVDSLMGRTAPADSNGTAAPPATLDKSDPKVQAALAAGYSEDEIRAYLGGKK